MLAEPKIIYEDENFLAVAKPAGLLVHRAKISSNRPLHKVEPDLVSWLLRRWPQIKNVGDEPTIRPGIVHRLDRDVSGVILVAKNQAYFEYLKSLFKNHQIKKNYLALVCGKLKPKRGIIEKPIGIKTGTIKRTTAKKAKMLKPAITKYKVLDYLKINGNDYSLVSVEPVTGRTHQIRVHLASFGCPVVGDKLYGLRRRKKGKLKASVSDFGIEKLTEKPRLMLHAFSVEFSREPGKRVKIESEPPEEFKRLLSQRTKS